MSDQPLDDVPDSILIARIARQEHEVRRHQHVLGVLNAEWTRRHATERCAVECREPRAPLGQP